MKQTDTDYLTMVSVTDTFLTGTHDKWENSEPATEQVATIRNLNTRLKAAQRGSTTNTTGITDDTETAVDAAIEEAVILSKAVRAYALTKKNMTLHNQFKVSERSLEKLSNVELIEYVKDMLQRMKDAGPELAKYDVTTAKLTAFEALINEADQRKTDTREAIVDRKGHNQSIPQLMKELKQAFAILDNLVSSWKKEKPDFVRDYFNARKVINTGGRGRDKDDKGEAAPGA